MYDLGTSSVCSLQRKHYNELNLNLYPPASIFFSTCGRHKMMATRNLKMLSTALKQKIVIVIACIC